jgi:hypothetical protein
MENTMQNGQIWVYEHESGDNREYQIVEIRDDRVLVNGPAGGETWSDAWITSKTEKGTLYMKKGTDQ